MRQLSKEPIIENPLKELLQHTKDDENEKDDSAIETKVAQNDALIHPKFFGSELKFTPTIYQN